MTEPSIACVMPLDARLPSPVSALFLKDECRPVRAFSTERQQETLSVTIHSLSDDDYAHILQFIANMTTMLPLVLTSRRWRAVQLSHQPLMVSTLQDIASKMTLFEWGLRMGCPYPNRLQTDTLCRAAARFGAVDVLVRAREAGCPWEQHQPAEAGNSPAQHKSEARTTIRVAAANGHTEFIKVAIKMGCSWGFHPMYAEPCSARNLFAALKLAKDCGMPVCIA